MNVEDFPLSEPIPESDEILVGEHTVIVRRVLDDDTSSISRVVAGKVFKARAQIDCGVTSSSKRQRFQYPDRLHGVSQVFYGTITAKPMWSPVLGEYKLLEIDVLQVEPAGAAHLV